MKVLIVEDEKLSRERLGELIHQYNPQIEILGETDSIEDTVNFLRSQEHPDLLFFDIQLADGLSFEIFKLISVSKPVIFTTAYDQYALKAFEVNSLDYLIKPISYEKLQQALDKYRQLKGELNSDFTAELTQALLSQKNAYKERFLVKLGRKLFYKMVSEIGYFQAEGKIVYLVENSSGRKYLIDHTLDELSNRLLDPSKYFRINRSFIISIESVAEIEPYSQQRLLVKLNQSHPHDLVVSREKATSFKAWLNY